MVLDFIRPTSKTTFEINDGPGLKLLTHLCVGFSLLTKNIIKHKFQGTMNPLCPCSLEADKGFVIKVVRVVLFGSKDFTRDASLSIINPLMNNVLKWLDTLQKSCSKCCKIFKVCLTILAHYALKV